MSCSCNKVSNAEMKEKNVINSKFIYVKFGEIFEAFPNLNEAWKYKMFMPY